MSLETGWACKPFDKRNVRVDSGVDGIDICVCKSYFERDERLMGLALEID